MSSEAEYPPAHALTRLAPTQRVSSRAALRASGEVGSVWPPLAAVFARLACRAMGTLARVVVGRISARTSANCCKAVKVGGALLAHSTPTPLQCGSRPTAVDVCLIIVLYVVVKRGALTLPLHLPGPVIKAPIVLAIDV